MLGPRSRRTLPPATCFFFQAEDGIRDTSVTGVQTCALPIWMGVDIADDAAELPWREAPGHHLRLGVDRAQVEIGRASCRERVDGTGGGGSLRRRTSAMRTGSANQDRSQVMNGQADGRGADSQ